MQIFIGGYATSGSRIPPMILERAGSYIGKNSGSTYDCGGIEFHDVFSNWFMNKSNKNKEALKAFLDDQIEGRNDWVLKHGHLMLIIPKLKTWYPSSKFILSVRHPLDQLLRWEGFPYPFSMLLHNYFQMSDNGPGEQCPMLLLNDECNNPLEEYGILHAEALKNTDLIWKLEDVCSDPVFYISKLLAFAKIDDDPIKFLDLIQPSSTIGMFRKTDFAPKDTYSIIQKLGYT